MNGYAKWLGIVGLAGGLLAYVITFEHRLTAVEEDSKSLEMRFEKVVQTIIQDLQERARENQEQKGSP